MNKIIWYNPEVDYLLKNPSGPVGRYLGKKAFLVKTAAEAQVGVKSGRLKRSLKISHSREVYGQSVSVSAFAIDPKTGTSYALMHHEGTRAHVILPVRASQLVFISRGRLVRTDRVNHPGTKPNKYLSDNLHLAL